MIWASEINFGPVDFKDVLARGPVLKNPNFAACILNLFIVLWIIGGVSQVKFKKCPCRIGPICLRQFLTSHCEKVIGAIHVLNKHPMGLNIYAMS